MWSLLSWVSAKSQYTHGSRYGQCIYLKRKRMEHLTLYLSVNKFRLSVPVQTNCIAGRGISISSFLCSIKGTNKLNTYCEVEYFRTESQCCWTHSYSSATDWALPDLVSVRQRQFWWCDHGELSIHSSRVHVMSVWFACSPCVTMWVSSGSSGFLTSLESMWLQTSCPVFPLDPGWLWAVLPEDESMNYGIDKVNLHWIMLPWIAQAAQMPKEHWTAVVKIFSNKTTCFINDTYGLKSYTWSPYACSFDTEWYRLLRLRVLQLLRGSLTCILPIRDSRNGRSGRQNRLSSGSSITDEDGIFINSASSKLLERAHGILM